MADDSPFVPAASIALLDGERVLLVERGRAPSKGMFAFPGGRVEAGETLEQAVRRELREETGLEAGPIAEVAVFEIEGEPPAPAFRLHVFSGEWRGGTAAAADDAASLGWFTLSDMAAIPVLESVVAVARRLLVPKNEAGSSCAGQNHPRQGST